MTKFMFLINHSISISLMGDVDNGEALHMWGQRVYGKSLYLPLGFSMNLVML